MTSIEGSGSPLEVIRRKEAEIKRRLAAQREAGKVVLAEAERRAREMLIAAEAEGRRAGEAQRQAAQAADLQRHAALVFAPLTRPGSASWTLESTGCRLEVALNPVLLANDATPIHAAVLAGSGIALIAEQLVKADVAAGRLERVLPEWSGPTLEVRAVYASKQGLLPRVRLFLDFLGEKALALAEQP